MAEAGQRVLLVDDDALFGLAVTDLLACVGAEVEITASLAGARRLELEAFDTIILDDRLPDGRGLELFARLTHQRVIVISAEPDVEMAIAALRHHAVDFLTKPVDPLRLRELVGGRAREPAPRSRAMAAVYATLSDFAKVDAPVLLRGETGTGKTRAARWLHDASPRAARPFVSVNCGALPESLIESELFGTERGAFTGAREARRGLLEAADGGTFLLDEIGELPLACQTKLLGVIESRAVRRVGGVEDRRVDVRFVAATHVDLEGDGLRRDLLYRLDVLGVELPPLRAQIDGLAALVGELLDGLGCARRLAAGELARLGAHDWPGNIRELRNLLHRAAVMQREGELEPSKLLAKTAPRGARTTPAGRSSARVATIEEVTLRHMVEVAETCPSRKLAAEMLGIGESTLRRKLKQARQRGLR